MVLQTLFDKHSVSEKNKYEILQIYSFLPNDKRQTLLNNFEILAQKAKKIEENIIVEQAILLDNIIPDIEKITQKN